MKKKKLSFSQIAAPVIVVIIAFMVVYLIALMADSRHLLNSQAVSIAGEMTSRNNSGIDNTIAVSMNRLNDMHKKSIVADDIEEFYDYLDTMRLDFDFLYLRYMHDGKEYNYDGVEYPYEEENKEIKSLVENSSVGMTGLICDYDETNIMGIASYLPVDNCEYMDGLIAYTKITDATDTYTLQENRQNTDDEDMYSGISPDYHAISSDSGRIVFSHTKDDFTVGSETNMFDLLRSMTADKDILDEVKNTVKNGSYGSMSVTFNNERYILAYSSIAMSDASMFVIDIYNAYDFLEQNYLVNNKIVITSMIIVAIFLLIIIILAVSHSIYKRKTRNSVAIDPELGCDSYESFLESAPDIIKSNSASKYAIIYLEVHQSATIISSFGDEFFSSMIKYINRILNRCMLKNEIYAPLHGRGFVLLIKYREVRDIGERVRIVNSLFHNYGENVKSKMVFRISSGVYCVNENENKAVLSMVDCAVVAQKVNSSQRSILSTIYDDSIQMTYLREREIESRMEAALENEEFKVFLQPQYNIKKKCIDGAEALVRWYDAEKNRYIVPTEFIPLFEVNNFVAKLDRYMFVKVCQYMSTVMSTSDKMIPLSVNISRVTASQVDFTDFVIQKKKLYNIPNGKIILEFSENFATENYEAMRNMVFRLKSNGFFCTLDNFGSGGSPYDVLKELAMDEVKLDRMFIKPGTNPERDNIILKSIISLAGQLHMKITQQGVEDAEQLDKLKENGCDSLQGYIYAKPMSLEEFEKFIKTDKIL